MSHRNVGALHVACALLDDAWVHGTRSILGHNKHVYCFPCACAHECRYFRDIPYVLRRCKGWLRDGPDSRLAFQCFEVCVCVCVCVCCVCVSQVHWCAQI